MVWKLSWNLTSFFSSRSAEPVNAPRARSVREAVDGLEALWAEAWAEYEAGQERDWELHRVRSLALWRIVNCAGGGDAFQMLGGVDPP